MVVVIEDLYCNIDIILSILLYKISDRKTHLRLITSLIRASSTHASSDRRQRWGTPKKEKRPSRRSEHVKYYQRDAGRDQRLAKTAYSLAYVPAGPIQNNKQLR
jgi:hypothetical protein